MMKFFPQFLFILTLNWFFRLAAKYAKKYKSIYNKYVKIYVKTTTKIFNLF